MLLAGDSGGTKTYLALFASKHDLRTPLLEAKLPSARYESLGALVKDFLAPVRYPVTRAVFGVSGPVVGRRAKITNLPWVVDERQLQEELAIPYVHLMNDLEVIATAIPLLDCSELYRLNAGKPVPHAPIAVAASGTGLGEAFLFWDGARYRTYPSEGGIANFAPANACEVDLLAYLLARQEYVSYDFLCSGVGLPHIYTFFKGKRGMEEPVELAARFASADDPTPVIVNAAMDEHEPVPLCVATLKTFVKILGVEAGNMALRMLSTGGVYIGGGIPPHILPFLHSEEFISAFSSKGPHSEWMSSIPVSVILNERAGVMGAAAYGFAL